MSDKLAVTQAELKNTIEKMELQRRRDARIIKALEEERDALQKQVWDYERREKHDHQHS